jgi:hypothetical protein
VWNRGIVHSFLILALVGGGKGPISCPSQIKPIEKPWYPLNWKLGGCQSRFGYPGDEKNLRLLLESKTRIIQPTARVLNFKEESA